jgi:hypothetical protein
MITSPAVADTSAVNVALLPTNATWLSGWTKTLTLAKAVCVPRQDIKPNVARPKQKGLLKFIVVQSLDSSKIGWENPTGLFHGGGPGGAPARLLFATRGSFGRKAVFSGAHRYQIG